MLKHSHRCLNFISFTHISKVRPSKIWKGTSLQRLIILEHGRSYIVPHYDYYASKLRPVNSHRSDLLRKKLFESFKFDSNIKKLKNNIDDTIRSSRSLGLANQRDDANLSPKTRRSDHRDLKMWIKSLETLVVLTNKRAKVSQV